MPDPETSQQVTHEPVEEWVGYPMLICSTCQEPWPCLAADPLKPEGITMLGPYAGSTWIKGGWRAAIRRKLKQHG